MQCLLPTSLNCFSVIVKQPCFEDLDIAFEVHLALGYKGDDGSGIARRKVESSELISFGCLVIGRNGWEGKVGASELFLLALRIKVINLL